MCTRSMHLTAPLFGSATENRVSVFCVFHAQSPTFLRTSPRDIRRKNKRKNRSISDRAAVDFGAGQGARVHGRYPRGSRPWEERRGQHPDRCNSLTLPCYRTCSVLTRSAVFITRSTFSRGGGATSQAPESRSLLKYPAAPRESGLGWMARHERRACPQ
jgi:hypothetical protein